MDLSYHQRPKDLGSRPLLIATAIAALTANVTNTFGLGSINDRAQVGTSNASQEHTAFLDELYFACFTAVADADGTVLATVKKWDKSAAAAVAMTGAFDLETITAKESTRIPITAAEIDRILDIGDYLYVEIVNNSAAINTQPVGLVLSAWLKLLK